MGTRVPEASVSKVSAFLQYYLTFSARSCLPMEDSQYLGDLEGTVEEESSSSGACQL